MNSSSVTIEIHTSLRFWIDVSADILIRTFAFLMFSVNWSEVFKFYSGKTRRHRCKHLCIVSERSHFLNVLILFGFSKHQYKSIFLITRGDFYVQIYTYIKQRTQFNTYTCTHMDWIHMDISVHTCPCVCVCVYILVCVLQREIYSNVSAPNFLIWKIYIII